MVRSKLPSIGLALAALLALTVAVGADDAGPPATVDLPSKQPATALAVIYSGDGGWQDLDKTIGEWMAGGDVHVVGVDSLHTFWEPRDPATVAADLEAILATADPSGALPVMVVGYSYGADIFPFAWPFLSEATKARIRLVTLLAPGHRTAFHVSVAGWIGVETGDHAVLPAIAALPPGRILCVYGSDEADSTPCTAKELAGAEIVETSGGHHFDGDYIGLGRRIRAAFDRRGAEAAHG